MLNLFLQALVGVGFLSAGVWWGYRRWVEPRASQLELPARTLLLLVSLTLMGGLIGSPFWWFGEPRAFAWALPPLAGRMLASAGWSFAVVCFLVLERPTRRRLRLVLLLLATYLAPLAAAILFFHLDRFDFSAAITYAFLAIVLAIVAAAAWFWFRFPAGFPEQSDGPAAIHGVARGWLALVILLTGLWGLALFLTDSGPSNRVWVWPGDLLTSRLIGVMLLTVAAGSAYALRNPQTVRPMLAMALMYGLGLCVASAWNSLAGKPVPLSYAVVFGVIAAGSAALWFTGRRASRE